VFLTSLGLACLLRGGPKVLYTFPRSARRLFADGAHEALASVRAKKGKIVQRDQSVFERAQEVLENQARAMAVRTGQPFEAAMRDVADTEAGRQLRELRDRSHRDEKAAEWQSSLLWRRIEERHYSWVESYIGWLKGREERAEYHALLEEELASLRG
jgi:hypothetical protein